MPKSDATDILNRSRTELWHRYLNEHNMEFANDLNNELRGWDVNIYYIP